jgi:hypothetical protein
MCFDIYAETVGVFNPSPDKRTEQLVNELYHDRARLEKELDDARSLADEAVESITALLEEMFPSQDPTVEMSQIELDLVINAAKLRLFAGG